MQTTIDGRVPVIHESITQGCCYIHSSDGNQYLDRQATWLSRPMHIADEHSWPTRAAVEQFIASHADATPMSDTKERPDERPKHSDQNGDRLARQRQAMQDALLRPENAGCDKRRGKAEVVVELPPDDERELNS